MIKARPADQNFSKKARKKARLSKFSKKARKKARNLEHFREGPLKPPKINSNFDDSGEKVGKSGGK